MAPPQCRLARLRRTNSHNNNHIAFAPRRALTPDAMVSAAIAAAASNGVTKVAVNNLAGFKKALRLFKTLQRQKGEF